MDKFTVIGCKESTGQVVSLHVWAKDATNAFASAAAIDSELSMVVALPGWQSEDEQLFFPGEGLVDGATVLEQHDVFGKPAFRLKAKLIVDVLEAYALRVTNTNGKSFKKMATELIDEIDSTRVVRVAMATESKEAMKQAAFDETKAALVDMGVLEF